MATEGRNDPDTSGKAGGTSDRLGREHDREVRQLERELNKRDLEINKLRKENPLLRKTIGELNRDVSELKKIVAALERRNKKMDEIIRDQGARLDYYENAHVPPSRQGPFHKNVGGNGKSGEDVGGSSKKWNAPGGTGSARAAGRGGVRGHKGGTRIFRPTGTVRHTAACCPNCEKTNIRDRKNDEKRPMVSIPEFAPPTP